MKRIAFSLAIRLLLPVFACAQASAPVHDHHDMAMPVVSPHDPPITITINPEARVSVSLAGLWPAPATCGTPVDVPVRIVSEGFVTTRLEAKLVGEIPPGVRLEFRPEPLKGIPEETRSLRLTLASPGQVDLTISFRAHNDIPDLGGRDRIHVLMHCR